MYIIYISPTAVDDITVAIEYYNSLATDLGYRFADVITNILSELPFLQLHQQYVIKTYVANLLKDFPFLLPIP